MTFVFDSRTRCRSGGTDTYRSRGWCCTGCYSIRYCVSLSRKKDNP